LAERNRICIHGPSTEFHEYFSFVEGERCCLRVWLVVHPQHDYHSHIPRITALKCNVDFEVRGCALV